MFQLSLYSDSINFKITVVSNHRESTTSAKSFVFPLSNILDESKFQQDINILECSLILARHYNADYMIFLKPIRNYFF